MSLPTSHRTQPRQPIVTTPDEISSFGGESRGVTTVRPPRPRSRRRPDYRLRGLDLGQPHPDDPPSPPTPKGHPRRRRRRRILISWFVVVTLATLVALLLREFVVQPFSVPSAAMMPTLQVGDQILVVKLSLLARPIGRGDVVVFSRPTHLACGGGRSAAKDLVERVVGLPGDTIWSTADAIYVDRHQLNEPGWYDPTSGEVGSTPILRTTIPPGDYFVMGDNRTGSCDSRSFGAIAGSSIVGKVTAIVLRNGHPHVHLLSSSP
jgi:signal peptidase I